MKDLPQSKLGRNIKRQTFSKELLMRAGKVHWQDGDSVSANVLHQNFKHMLKFFVQYVAKNHRKCLSKEYSTMQGSEQCGVPLYK